MEGDEIEGGELVAGVTSPRPTGRKDCGGRRDRQNASQSLAGRSPIPMGRKDHRGNDPPKALDVLDTRGRYGAVVAGLSFGAGAGCQGSRKEPFRC